MRRESDGLLVVAVIALVVTATLPLTRVYVGLGFLRPVLASALLAIGVSWGCRRLRLGPLLTSLATLVAWALFVGQAFFPETLWLGLAPTTATLAAARDLVSVGAQLIRDRPAPTFPEPALLFLTASGTWLVAHAVAELVLHLASPGRAVLCALVLLTVPLTLGPPAQRAWVLAVPFLVAAALLLLAAAGRDLRGWGGWALPGEAPRLTRRLAPAGTVVASSALVVGLVLAGTLPGYGAPPWYQVRGSGGTTLTTNPIVALRPSLVSQDQTPLLRVTSPRPVYLRTTVLDTYGEREEWTASTIRGRPIGRDGSVPPEVSTLSGDAVPVEVEVVGLDGVLVPAPYQPLAVMGADADRFQYDRRTATFTLDRGVTLADLERYTVLALLPDRERVPGDPIARRAPVPELVALPGNVPPEVAELARQIVDEAGAETPFEQALAIQNELRTWTYSLEPPPGHSSAAMASFIETRIGYCEQFAGTMAVMLRTLGIPARVAVGFTPGRPAAEEENVWLVSRANAHAWVEVLFPGHGWLSFEPTPRADGNVLVPTAADVMPAETAAAATPAGEIPTTDPAEPGANPGDLSNVPPDVLNQSFSDTTVGLSTDARGRGWRRVLGAGAGLGALAVAGLAALAVQRSRRPPLTPPARVLAARQRVWRLGRGLGLRAQPAETDREYLARLAVGCGADGAAAARVLAAASERARFAPHLPAAAAAEADAAAAALEHALLRGTGPLRRLAARTLARLSFVAPYARLRMTNRQWWSPRSRLSRM